LNAIEKDLANWRYALAWLTVVFVPGVIVERWVLRLQKRCLDNPAMLLFSSPAQGNRAVVLSRRNIAASTASITKPYDCTPHDRILTTLSWADCAGISMAIWTPLTSGMATLISDQLETEHASNVIEASSPTIVCCRDQQLERLMDQATIEKFRT